MSGPNPFVMIIEIILKIIEYRPMGLWWLACEELLVFGIKAIKV